MNWVVKILILQLIVTLGIQLIIYIFYKVSSRITSKN